MIASMKMGQARNSKFKPVRHDHKAFVEKAAKRKGFVEAYDALALEYQLAKQVINARSQHFLEHDGQVAYRHG